MRIALREVMVIGGLDHPNVVKLQCAFRSPSGRVCMCFDYGGQSAQQLLSQRYPRGVPPKQLKRLAFQLAQSVRYLHTQKVIHRDIKPANVLVDSDGVLRLCDFGFARYTSESAHPRGGERLTPYVVTRWYRAPEVLLGMPYGEPADVWSLGCTLAELATGEPLLPGESSLDQLARIVRTMGPLPPRMAACLNPHLREAPVLTAAAAQAAAATAGSDAGVHVSCPPGLRQRLGAALSGPLLELLAACLRTDPRDRPTAEQLLAMPYFLDAPYLFAGTSLEQHYVKDPAYAAVAAPAVLPHSRRCDTLPQPPAQAQAQQSHQLHRLMRIPGDGACGNEQPKGTSSGNSGFSCSTADSGSTACASRTVTTSAARSALTSALQSAAMRGSAASGVGVGSGAASGAGTGNGSETGGSAGSGLGGGNDSAACHNCGGGDLVPRRVVTAARISPSPETLLAAECAAEGVRHAAAQLRTAESEPLPCAQVACAGRPQSSYAHDLMPQSILEVTRSGALGAGGGCQRAAACWHGNAARAVQPPAQRELHVSSAPNGHWPLHFPHAVAVDGPAPVPVPVSERALWSSAGNGGGLGRFPETGGAAGAAGVAWPQQDPEPAVVFSREAAVRAMAAAAALSRGDAGPMTSTSVSASASASALPASAPTAQSGPPVAQPAAACTAAAVISTAPGAAQPSLAAVALPVSELRQAASLQAHGPVVRSVSTAELSSVACSHQWSEQERADETDYSQETLATQMTAHGYYRTASGLLGGHAQALASYVLDSIQPADLHFERLPSIPKTLPVATLTSAGFTTTPKAAVAAPASLPASRDAFVTAAPCRKLRTPQPQAAVHAGTTAAATAAAAAATAASSGLARSLAAAVPGVAAEAYHARDAAAAAPHTAAAASTTTTTTTLSFKWHDATSPVDPPAGTAGAAAQPCLPQPLPIAPAAPPPPPLALPALRLPGRHNGAAAASRAAVQSSSLGLAPSLYEQRARALYATLPDDTNWHLAPVHSAAVVAAASYCGGPAVQPLSATAVAAAESLTAHEALLCTWKRGHRPRSAPYGLAVLAPSPLWSPIADSFEDYDAHYRRGNAGSIGAAGAAAAMAVAQVVPQLCDWGCDSSVREGGGAWRVPRAGMLGYRPPQCGSTAADAAAATRGLGRGVNAAFGAAQHSAAPAAACVGMPPPGAPAVNADGFGYRIVQPAPGPLLAMAPCAASAPTTLQQHCAAAATAAIAAAIASAGGGGGWGRNWRAAAAGLYLASPRGMAPAHHLRPVSEEPTGRTSREGDPTGTSGGADGCAKGCGQGPEGSSGSGEACGHGSVAATAAGKMPGSAASGGRELPQTAAAAVNGGTTGGAGPAAVGVGVGARARGHSVKGWLRRSRAWLRCLLHGLSRV